jgi:hypothetical protein
MRSDEEYVGSRSLIVRSRSEVKSVASEQAGTATERIRGCGSTQARAEVMQGIIDARPLRKERSMKETSKGNKAQGG